MRKVVITAGRFNPPTRGHGVLIRQLKKVAEDTGAQAEVFVVDGEKSGKDKLKNPLTAEQRVSILRSWYPSVRFDVVNSAYDVMEVLEVQNKLPIAWIAGSDRVSNYRKLLDYQGHTKSRVVEIDRIAGEADGISATLARQAAVDDNFEEFCRMMPAHVVTQDLRQIMGMIRQAQGLYGV